MTISRLIVCSMNLCLCLLAGKMTGRIATISISSYVTPSQRHRCTTMPHDQACAASATWPQHKVQSVKSSRGAGSPRLFSITEWFRSLLVFARLGNDVGFNKRYDALKPILWREICFLPTSITVERKVPVLDRHTNRPYAARDGGDPVPARPHIPPTRVHEGDGVPVRRLNQCDDTQPPGRKIT